MLKLKTGFFKKVTAMTAAVAVSLSVAGVGYAETYTQSTYEQPTVIDVFNTFDSFDTSATSAEFFAPATIRQSASNLVLQDDGKGGNAVKFKGSSWVDYVFDEVIKTGVLHVGFDYKANSTSITQKVTENGAEVEKEVANGIYVRGFSNRRRPDNMNFTWTWDKENEGNDTELWLASLNIGASNSLKKITYPNSFGEANAPSSTGANNIAEDLDTDWHRYDMYIYFGVSNNTGVYYFKDGVFKKQGTATNGLKSIGFGGGSDGALMDNFVVEHYPTVKDGLTAGEENGYYKTAQIKMDAKFTSDATKKSAGSVDLVFSEPLNIPDMLEKTDFTVKDMSGEIVEGAIEGIDNDSGFNRLTLTLDKDRVTPGVYTLSVSEDLGDYYTGKISETLPQSVMFVVSPETIDADTVRYYMNEEFNDYSGGMPNGFVKTSDLSYDGTYGILSEADATKGKGIKLSGEDIAYKFPKAIKDGNFTIEFDVKATANDDWYVALPLAHVFESDEWTQADGWQGDFNGGSIAWADKINRDAGYLIGHSSTATGNTVQYATGKSADFKTQDSSPVNLGNLALTADEWNNFKIDVDLSAGEAYVILNNDSENKATIKFDASRFNSEVLGKKATEEGGITGKTLNDRKIMPGIGGLRLVAGDESNVVYDNVKVYSDASFNAANDFDTWSSDRQFNHTGWPQIDNEYAPVRTTTGYSYQVTTNGTTTEKSETGNKYGSYVSYGDRASANLTANKIDTLIGAEERAENNKALKILGQSNQTDKGYQINSHGINYYFNVPIKAGKAFDIEMDLYLPAENNAFSIGLFTSANEFGLKTKIAESGTFGVYGTEALANTVLYNLDQGSGKTTGDGSVYFYNGTGQPYGNNTSNPLKIDGGDNIKLNVFSDATDSENDGWTKIKFSYIPKSDGVYFKVTVGEGTDAKVSQEYKSAMSAANDVLGIQFNHGIAPTGSGIGSSFNVDNIKVMETNAVSNNAVSGVYGVKNDGTEQPIDGNTVTTDNETIEIKTAKPLTNLDGARFFLNKTDESGKNIEVTAKLSEDKSSIIIPITEQMITLSNDNNLTVTAQLPATLESTDSYLGFFEAQTLTYNIAEADGNIDVSEFRLYRYIPDSTRKNSKGNEETVEGGWYPVSQKEIKFADFPAETTRYKLVAKGNNSGKETNVTLLWATQDEDYLMTANKVQVTAPEKGSFIIESDEFNLETAPQTFKAVLWEDMKPLKQMLILEKQAEAEPAE